MWKKEDGPTARDAGEDAPRMTTSRSTAGSSAKATIGPSISIKGDVTGSEDLLIQGRVDGSVTLDHHSVSVGSEGQVKANITGRVITIEGKVDGDLTAEEQIVLLGSAQVHGDIKAPRVVLEDGATFRGLVDMGAPGKDANAEGTSRDKASTSETKAGGASASSPSSPSGSTSGSSSQGKKETSGVSARNDS